MDESKECRDLVRIDKKPPDSVLLRGREASELILRWLALVVDEEAKRQSAWKATKTLLVAVSSSRR